MSGAESREEQRGIRTDENPRLVYELVSAVVKAIEKPVTVKIRKGFDDEHVNAVEIAKIIEEAGASAVAVHGRTRNSIIPEKQTGEIIRQVKEAFTSRSSATET